jgi:8-oxo-dGTP pyrophosphatase MutT (NUDIX family)
LAETAFTATLPDNMSGSWIRGRKIGFKGFNTLEVLDTQIGEREVLRRRACVNVLPYDPVGRRVLFIRQARAAFAGIKSEDGMTTECIAGLIDDGETPMQAAIRESWEEAGIRLSEEDVTLLNGGIPMATSSGYTDEVATLAFAELSPGSFDPQKNTFGLASEGEHIERVWIPIDQLPTYVCEDARAFALVQYTLRRLGIAM